MRRAFTVLVVALVAASISTAAPKKRRKSEPLGLISGTVFQSTGFSLPGAKVFAVSKQNPKVKKDTVTGRRGEFALRLPAGLGAYVVTAEAKGFASQQRTADVYEGTKTTVTFQLKPVEGK